MTAPFFSTFPGTCIINSGKYLALFPSKTITLVNENLLIICTRDREEYVTSNALERMRKELTPKSGLAIPEWIGFLSYEFGGISDPRKQIPLSSSNLPLAYFQQSALILTDRNIYRFAAPIDRECEKYLDKIECGEEFKANLNVHTCIQRVKWGESQKSYEEKIRRVQEEIARGTFYQLNLSHEFSFRGEFSPYTLFEKMMRESPTQCSAYMQLNGHTIVSNSPERLVTRKNGLVETSPIKGTMPRGKTDEEDQFLKEKLLRSEKERAELLMITDLLRNDLHRISDPGSVHVAELFGISSYPNVHHMHSTICSKSHAHPFDLLRAVFPGGSITGCPKLRSIEMIHAFEKRPRKIYTGSLGYISGNGDMDFNICIRTLLCEGDTISLGLGGAIVADSDPKKEYEETLHKGKTLFEVLC